MHGYNGWYQWMILLLLLLLFLLIWGSVRRPRWDQVHPSPTASTDTAATMLLCPRRSTVNIVPPRGLDAQIATEQVGIGGEHGVFAPLL